MLLLVLWNAIILASLTIRWSSFFGDLIPELLKRSIEEATCALMLDLCLALVAGVARVH